MFNYMNLIDMTDYIKIGYWPAQVVVVVYSEVTMKR